MPHHVAKREEYSAQQHHAEKKPDEMPALEYSVPAPATPVPPRHSLLLAPCYTHPLRNDVYRQRKDDRRIFLDTDFRQRLQITQLDRHRLLLQRRGRFGQLRRGLELAVRVNDFRAALALRLRLAGDGALHLLRNIDLLDLYLRYLDTPRLRILVKDYLQLRVYLFALGEDLVQFELAQHAAQIGLRKLGSGIQVVLHLRYGEIRVHHAVVTHRFDVHR